MCKTFVSTDLGEFKIGGKVKLNPNRDENFEYNGTLENDTYYTIRKFIRNGDSIFVNVELEEIPCQQFPLYDFIPKPTAFNVYKWKKHYILSGSINQAQLIWNTWLDLLEIQAGEGRPKLFKVVNNLKNIQDDELFPRRLNITCEYKYPCILKNLEWDDDSVLYTYRYPIEE